MLKINKIINKYKMSIRFRMMVVFLGVMSILVLVNVYNYSNINDAIANINLVYEKNYNLNELKDELINVQDCLTEYLENKNTDSMEDYYRHAQIYQDMIESLNHEVVDEEFFLMEKNVYNISTAYLSSTNKAIEYKRGRDIEKYRVEYVKTEKLKTYLTSYIDSLNTARFRANSDNHSAMVSVLEYTQKLSIIILVIVICSALILISLATSQITSPLRRLAITADIVAKGKLDVEPVEIEINDEVGVVTKAFNKMLYSIREYIDRITENMEREKVLEKKELLMNAHLKEAQLNYLQAQINPHFLFNTLNAGAQLAMMEDAERTYEYIQNVADFYRYIIKNNKLVRLADEIELVDNFMYIINVRYMGDIKYSKQIDEAVTDVMVPSMILQPIVENSIKYGVTDIEWEAHIDISVEKEDEYVCIRVSDNGVGISEDVINEIINNSGENDEKNNAERSSESTGIGLKNVIRRLRLHYGAENVMEIYSDGPDRGTMVTLLIPYDNKVLLGDEKDV